MIYYLPIEPLDMRYSKFMNKYVEDYLEKLDTPYRIIEPVINIEEPPNGCFLHASQTIEFKARQLNYIAQEYKSGLMVDGDIIFCADLWFPGIESIAYLNHFHKVNVQLRGFIHAGSWTDSDEVANIERWAMHFENAIFDIADKVFFATEFSMWECIKKRNLDELKCVVTPLPLDYEAMNKYRYKGPKENIIVFNGRNHPEKQPHLFDELRERANLRGEDWTFIATHKFPLDKNEYYQLLSRAKVVVSFALQENFGIGILEAVYLGCIPIVPDRLAYKELYHDMYRYKSLFECEEMINIAMRVTHQANVIFPIRLKQGDSIARKWFKAL